MYKLARPFSIDTHHRASTHVRHYQETDYAVEQIPQENLGIHMPVTRGGTTLPKLEPCLRLNGLK